jgi:hypothetical protein
MCTLCYYNNQLAVVLLPNPQSWVGSQLFDNCIPYYWCTLLFGNYKLFCYNIYISFRFVIELLCTIMLLWLCKPVYVLHIGKCSATVHSVYDLAHMLNTLTYHRWFLPPNTNVLTPQWRGGMWKHPRLMWMRFTPIPWKGRPPPVFAKRAYYHHHDHPDHHVLHTIIKWLSWSICSLPYIIKDVYSQCHQCLCKQFICYVCNFATLL